MSNEKKIFETRDDSIIEYSKYVNDHIAHIHMAFTEFGPKLCKDIEEMINLHEDLYLLVRPRILKHDESKFTEEEFMPYAQKFYAWKGMDKSQEEVEEEFNKAWDHHYKNNDHHPEYWVKDNIPTNMYPSAIAEMLIDWIAMSMARNQNMYEWWTNDKGGKDEKSKLMTKTDFDIVNRWMEMSKNFIDFSKRNNDNE